MSTEFFNDQWRIPSNKNQNKISNYSMSFDGTNQGINLGSDFPYPSRSTDPWSISFWIKPNSATSSGIIFSTYDVSAIKGIYVNLRTGGSNNDPLHVQSLMRANANGYSSVITSDPIAVGEWQHIAVAFNGSYNATLRGITIYVNGSPVSIYTIGGVTVNGSLVTSADKYIGQREDNSNYLTDCDLDQVTFFDYALSQDQVTQLHNPGYAFNFNYLNSQYINVGDLSSLSGATSVTASIWYKRELVKNEIMLDFNQLPSGSGGRIGMQLHTGSFIYINGTNYKHPFLPTVGEWYNYVLVFDGAGATNEDKLKMYVDGTELTGGTYSGTVDNALGTLNSSMVSYIGAISTLSLFFEGQLSNASIFSSALTGPQVSTLYNNGQPGDISSLNPLGWWKLDDTATFNSGTSVWSIPDDSSNSNTGTSVGMNASNLVASNINGELIANPMITSPKPIAYYQLGDQSVSTGPTSDYLVPNNSLSDYVFDFDGTDDYIDLGSTDVLFDSTQGFSFSAWVKLDGYTNSEYPTIANIKTNSTPGWAVFLSQTSTPGNYQGLNFGSKTSFARIKTDGNISQDFIGQWKHVCITFDGVSKTAISSYTVYIDGSPVALTNSYLFGVVPNVNTIGIGATSTNTFDGLVSNVSTFNTELTSTQVETIYNNGAPGDISSLSPTAWYKLNAADTFDGSDWTINDYGSGGNDGTSSGMDSSNLVVSDLQQTSGYSPYALDFDAINDALTIQNSSTFNLGTAFTISGWFNFGSNKYQGLISFDATSGGSPRGWFLFQISSSNDIRLFDGANIFTLKTSYTTTNQWDSFIITYDGTDLVFYINGNQESTQAVSIDLQTNGNDAQIGNNQFASGRFFDGKISNIAFWNVGLTSTQVTEVFNEGRPSDLHNFSGTAPVAWWQLGSNSSFNTNWTCLDEIGTNNAVSAGNMTNDAITDGPGYSASGLGTSSIDIVGDAPYSTANGLSENMDVLDRVTDVPS